MALVPFKFFTTALMSCCLDFSNFLLFFLYIACSHLLEILVIILMASYPLSCSGILCNYYVACQKLGIWLYILDLNRYFLHFRGVFFFQWFNVAVRNNIFVGNFVLR